MYVHAAVGVHSCAGKRGTAAFGGRETSASMHRPHDSTSSGGEHAVHTAFCRTLHAPVRLPSIVLLFLLLQDGTTQHSEKTAQLMVAQHAHARTLVPTLLLLQSRLA